MNMPSGQPERKRLRKPSSATVTRATKMLVAVAGLLTSMAAVLSAIVALIAALNGHSLT